MMMMTTLYLMIFSCSISSFFVKNFLFLWMMMEICNFMMIFILIKLKSNYKIIFYYFMINFISSTMIIFILTHTNTPMSSSKINSMMFFMAMMLKNGIIPFHSWLIQMYKYIEWDALLIISTIMKIIPLNMFWQYWSNNYYYILWLSMMIMITPIMTFKSQKLKKIMGYSSSMHASILMIMTTINYDYMMMYLFIYSTLMFTLFKLLKKLKISSMYTLKFIPYKPKMLMIFYMFNISSLPPFTTFIMKWLMVESIPFKMFSLMTMIILFSSLLMSWNYFNFCNKFYSYKKEYVLNMYMYKKQKLFYLTIFTYLVNILMISFLLYNI